MRVSVLVPSRHEIYLQRTIDDLFAKASEEIEVIVILDGYWPDPPIVDRKNLVILHRGKPRGMRDAINSSASIAKGDYLMKCDAHCAFAPNFDVELKSQCKDNWLVVPVRYALDVEQWNKTGSAKEFQYVERGTLKGKDWPEFAARVEGKLFPFLLTTQGSCWFMKKSWFEELGGLDTENFGVMGREAQEVTLKTWLNGGQCILNRNTWYAHWNKPKEYVVGGMKKEKEKSSQYINSILTDDKLEGLINMFSPVPTWDDDKQQTIELNETPKVTAFDMSKRITPQIKERYGIVDSGNPMILSGQGRIELYKLFADLGYKVGCEVGVQRGRNSYYMLETIPDLHLFIVDPYKDHNFGYRSWDRYHAKYQSQVIKRLKDRQVVEFIFDFSENAHKRIPDRSLDFVYIDGDHSYDFVMLDIILWIRKVKEGGIIAGHDYFTNSRRQSKIAKVTSAVDDYTRMHRIPFFVTDYYKNIPEDVDGDQYSSWFWVNERIPRFNFKQKSIGIVQYTDNFGDQNFLAKCRKQLNQCAEKNNISDIICVSHRPVLDLGRNVVVDFERSVLSIFKQVLIGLKECQAEIVYLCEHDMIYHPTH